MFIDEVAIKVVSGKWWDWLVSWRREKYIPKGGPWGGNGWKWWDVFVISNENINTLSDYRHKKVLKAQDGEKWGTNTVAWANAPDLYLEVPVGTLIKNQETDELIWDLNHHNEKVLIAQGWKGWFWNAHFCSSVRQAPGFAELGDVAIEVALKLELKLVADIGIIWVPSAGKSTFINNVTNVKAKVADYPFTTITPNLWVLDHKWKSLVLEDVPGLIEWASEWKWLGIQFLKHIERTKVLLHMLDSYRLDQVFSDYETIRTELGNFSESLLEKQEIIVFSKIDLLDHETLEYLLEEFKVKHSEKRIFTISAATWKWINDLKDYLIDEHCAEFTKNESYFDEASQDKQWKVNSEQWVEDWINHIIQNWEDENQVKKYDLRNQVDPKKVTVKYLWDMKFQARWERLEQIVRMTDFDNKEAIMRVYDVLDKMNVMRDIQKIIKKEEVEWIDNDFFFEGSEQEDFAPSVEIAWKEIALDRLRYSL